MVHFLIFGDFLKNLRVLRRVRKKNFFDGFLIELLETATRTNGIYVFETRDALADRSTTRGSENRNNGDVSDDGGESEEGDDGSEDGDDGSEDGDVDSEDGEVEDVDDSEDGEVEDVDDSEGEVQNGGSNEGSQSSLEDLSGNRGSGSNTGSVHELSETESEHEPEISNISGMLERISTEVFFINNQII